jgi:cbb3-type cytochrome oxidase maturation protein
MSVIVILIIFSVLVAGGFLGAFIWAVRSGQYDDTKSPAVRILFDDNKEKTKVNADQDETDDKSKKK